MFPGLTYNKNALKRVYSFYTKYTGKPHEEPFTVVYKLVHGKEKGGGLKWSREEDHGGREWRLGNV